MVKHDQIEPTVDGLCYPVGASAFAAEWWEGKEAPEGALGVVVQRFCQVKWKGNLSVGAVDGWLR